MSSSEIAPNLVPGRECGFCTVCCYALPIDTPEMRKASGAVCVNCTGRGCAIYEARPSNCRGFFCGWRMLAQLDEGWRPDRSGVLVMPQNENVPEDFALREGIEFMILGGEDAVRRPGFVQFLAMLVARRVPVFLAVPGPVGTVAARVFANKALLPPVEKGDLNAVTDAILKFLVSMREHTFLPDTFRHGPQS